MLDTRIAVADEYQIVISALVHYLNACGSYTLCHESDSSEKLFENLETTPCEVIITDFYLRDSSGLEGLQLIKELREKWPSARIILFTAMNNPSVLQRVMRMGVQAIVSKRDPLAELREALHYRKRLQRPYLSSSLQHIVVSTHCQAEQQDAALTRREIEVLRFVGEGVRLVHIASRLGVSVSTIATHKANIMRKLGLESDLLLAQYAQQCGIADQRSAYRA